MALGSEYTPYSHQLISHELAELQDAEAMEQEFRDYMARKQRPTVTDPFAGQRWQPQPLLMSQRDYDDIVEWGKSIEGEVRKEQMQAKKFLIDLGRPPFPGSSYSDGASFSARENRRADARDRKKRATAERLAKKGKRR